MDKVDKPLADQLQEAETALQSYRSLAKSPGWGLLVEVVQTQARGRVNALMQPIEPRYDTMVFGQQSIAVPVDGMTQVLQREYIRGVRAGSLMVSDLPRAMIEHLEQEVRRLRLELIAEENSVKEGMH